MKTAKPHFIVLEGAANSGKTTAFKELYECLTEDEEIGRYFLSPKNQSESVETRALIYTQGFLIALLSAGDILDYIAVHVKKFILLRCDIIICACHPTNDYRQLIAELSAETQKPVFIIKKEAKDTDQKRVVREIKLEIKKIINQ